MQGEADSDFLVVDSFRNLRLSTAEEIRAGQAGYKTLTEYRDASLPKKLASPEPVGTSATGTSKHGYKIGQRVEMIRTGFSFVEDGLQGEEISCKMGERGIITNFSDTRTEVLRDSGKYIIRNEEYPWQFMRIVSETESDSRPIIKEEETPFQWVSEKKSPFYIPSREEEKYIQEAIIIKQPKKAKIIIV